MRRAVAIFVFAAAAYVALHRAYRPSPTAVTRPQSAASPSTQAPTATPRVVPSAAEAERDDADFQRAIAQHAHDVPVRGGGVVVAILKDDNTGERHQRFIVRLPRGETILITHNIDIAPSIEDLRVGDSMEFAGEYVWSEKGGLVHWTHHDPFGRHRAGYLLVRGHQYQ